MPRNTADSLREQINRANEQSLHRKRTETTGQNKPTGAAERKTPAPQTRQPAAQGQPVQSRPGLNQPGLNQPGQNQPRQNIPRQSGQPVQDPTRKNQPQQPSKPGQIPVQQNRQPVPKPQPVQNAARPGGQNVQRANEQSIQKHQTSNGAGDAAARRPAAAGSELPSAAETGRQASPGRQIADPRVSAQSYAKPQNYPQRNLEDDRTRLTDLSSIQRTSGQAVKKVQPKKKPQIQRTEVVYEDEGGNTVVSIVKAVIYIIFVVVISVFLSIGVIKVGNDVFAFVKNDVSIDVTIPEYASLDDITEILYQNEVIEYPAVFKVYAQLKKDVDNFLAGDYVVSPNMSYDDLRDAFKPQPKLGISEITIPEGYTTDEIIDLMVSYGIGTREGYEEAIANYEFDYWFLKELEEDGVDENRIYRLDGYLFPDTYQFYNSSSEVTVLNKLLKRFGQIFKEEYKIQTQSMGYTVDEIINLAAMIEKEAGTPSEFFKVSSVFHNRLQNWKSRPMLESDATIVYAIQHETGERPKLTSTDYETPYNTYTYAGLPPGPIANPSASAILAALSPADTEYYYFVSDGNVSYFSESKEQHQIFIEEIKKGTIREYVINMEPESNIVQ